jgi:hypothetical protein
MTTGRRETGSTLKKPDKLRALLIDPWQRRIHEIQIGPTLASWYKALGCTCVGRVEIHRNPQGTRAVDVWTDDVGLLREPVPPRFQVQLADRGNAVRAGCGLVLNANLQNRESIDCTFCAERLKPLIRWEHWEKRLDVRDYFEQLSKIPQWELRPGT